jgi:hypothetical protein
VIEGNKRGVSSEGYVAGLIGPATGLPSGDVSNSELTFSTTEIPRLESLVKENSACNFLETNGNAGFE